MAPQPPWLKAALQWRRGGHTWLTPVSAIKSAKLTAEASCLRSSTSCEESLITHLHVLFNRWKEARHKGQEHRSVLPWACLPVAGGERCCTIAQPCAASAYSCSSVLSVPAVVVSYAPRPTQGSSDGSTRVPTHGSDSVFMIRSA